MKPSLKLGCQDAGRLGGNQELIAHSSLLIVFTMSHELSAMT